MKEFQNQTLDFLYSTRIQSTIHKININVIHMYSRTRFGVRLANIKFIQLHWYYVEDNPNEGDNSNVMYEEVFSYM